MINCFRMDFFSRTPTRSCFPQTTCGAHRSQFGIHVLAILGDIFNHGVSRHALNWIAKFILSSSRPLIWSDSFSCYLTTLSKLQGFRSVDLGKRWLLMLSVWGCEGVRSMYVSSYYPLNSLHWSEKNCKFSGMLADRYKWGQCEIQFEQYKAPIITNCMYHVF